MNERTQKIKRILTETIEEHERIWHDIKYQGKRSYPALKLKEEDIIVLSSGLDRRFNEII